MSRDEEIKTKILDYIWCSGSIGIKELKSSGFDINHWNWLYNIGCRYDGSGSFYIPNFEKF